MAEVPYESDELKTHGDRGSVVTWKGMKREDVGKPIERPGSEIVGVVVHGSFGESGAIVIEGSNDGDKWIPFALRDNGTLVVDDVICVPQGMTRFVRPAVRGGDEKTRLFVSMLVMRDAR